jgi:glycyl-tRNA synthetase
MLTAPNNLLPIIAYAKEHGFIYPSSEIYEGLQAVYDYGAHGIALKRNIQELWWKTMTQTYSNNLVGMDAAILMHPRIWEASGHVGHFSDWMVDNKDSKKRYRVDLLIENHAERLMAEGKREAAENIGLQLQQHLNNDDAEALYELLTANNIICPLSKSCHWSAVRRFNLMFATQVGSQEEETTMVYLRPETAQGIFVNFHNVQKTTRQKLPFGIAQIGKAFRNEIVARQFIFRMREFEQMEMQFFIKPDTDNSWFSYWQTARLQWYIALGIQSHKLRITPHGKLAHYAKAASDIEYQFPFGFREIEGIHARGDFDLKNHEEASKKNLKYFDPHLNKHYLPHVVETSAGCDRLILMLLCENLKTTSLASEAAEKTRTYLQLPPSLAPIKVAVFPLIKEPPLQTIAWQLYRSICYRLPSAYEENQSIGKRYTRQDLIGTPYCVTIDHQTLQDQTVTLRERDTMHQERIPLDTVRQHVEEATHYSQILEKLHDHTEKMYEQFS